MKNYKVVALSLLAVLLLFVLAVPYYAGMKARQRVEASLQQFSSFFFDVSWSMQAGIFSSKLQLQLVPKRLFSPSLALQTEHQIAHGPLVKDVDGHWRLGLAHIESHIYLQQQLLQRVTTFYDWQQQLRSVWSAVPYEGDILYEEQTRSLNWQGISGEIHYTKEQQKLQAQLAVKPFSWREPHYQHVQVAASQLQISADMDEQQGMQLQWVKLSTPSLLLEDTHNKTLLGLENLLFTLDRTVSGTKLAYGLQLAADNFYSTTTKQGAVQLNMELSAVELAARSKIMAAWRQLLQDFSWQALGGTIRELANLLPKVSVQGRVKAESGDLVLAAQAQANNKPLSLLNAAQFAPSLFLLRAVDAELHILLPEVLLLEFIEGAKQFRYVPYVIAEKMPLLYQQLLLRQALQLENGLVTTQLSLLNGTPRINGNALIPLLASLGAYLLLQDFAE